MFVSKWICFFKTTNMKRKKKNISNLRLYNTVYFLKIFGDLQERHYFFPSKSHDSCAS